MKEGAERGEGAIRKENDVSTEQETWSLKDTGVSRARKIMDDAKVKQRGRNIEKHSEKQRALMVQLENQNAEIDRLQTEIFTTLKHCEEKDEKINQLRALFEMLRQEDGIDAFSLNAQHVSFRASVMAEINAMNSPQTVRSTALIHSEDDEPQASPLSAGILAGALNLPMSGACFTTANSISIYGEERGIGYLLSYPSRLISLTALDEPPIADGKEDDVPKEQETWMNTGGAKTQEIMDEFELDDSKMKQQWGSNIEKDQRALEAQLETQNAEIVRLQAGLSAALKHSEEKDKEINHLQDTLERLRQEAAIFGGFFRDARGFNIQNPVMTDIRGDFHLHTDREKRGSGCLLSNLYRLISFTVLDELPIAADGLYDSLSRSNPSFCHPGTHEKVLNAITDWVDEPDPEKRILWVNGLGGTGKSTIAQTIIKHYKDSRIAATFFFLKGHADCGHANRLFTTLAWQMTKSIPETHQHIESVLNTQRNIHTKDLDAQSQHLFVEVFNRVPELRPEKSIIVIDGIDAFSPERRQTKLLTLIGDRLATPVIPLRFIIFSRPEPRIEEIFLKENMSKITHTLALDKYAPQEDIRKYLTDKFRHVFAKRNAQLPSDRDIDGLVSKSPGQFIFASTVVSFIGDDNFLPQEQLSFIQRLRVTEHSPFALMDQLYMHILSQQTDTKMLRDLFVLLIAFGHPKLSFVSQRLGINEKRLRLNLHAIRALVHITDSNIGAYHRTLHDFFLDRQRSKQYYIHPLRVYLVLLPRKARMFWGRV